jgi:RNA polymerase sigma factor (sigma-70 family)
MAAGLTERSWDDLFDFLDPRRGPAGTPDRDAAASARSLEILRRLVCFFGARGCGEAEDLAVETLLRVAARCRQVDEAGPADPLGYCYGVARNVFHEWVRGAAREASAHASLRHELVRTAIPDPGAWRDEDRVHRSLERCLSQLSSRARRLVLGYYGHEGAARIQQHRRLAEELGKSVNALRIEVHRIRQALRACVFGRLGLGTSRPGASDGRNDSGRAVISE